MAVVSHVERDPGKPFANVQATPAVHLDRSLEVLLVRSPPPVPGSAEESAATAAETGRGTADEEARQ